MTDGEAFPFAADASDLVGRGALDLEGRERRKAVERDAFRFIDGLRQIVAEAVAELGVVETKARHEIVLGDGAGGGASGEFPESGARGFAGHDGLADKQFLGGDARLGAAGMTVFRSLPRVGGEEFGCGEEGARVRGVAGERVALAGIEPDQRSERDGFYHDIGAAVGALQAIGEPRGELGHAGFGM